MKQIKRIKAKAKAEANRRISWISETISLQAKDQSLSVNTAEKISQEMGVITNDAAHFYAP